MQTRWVLGSGLLMLALMASPLLIRMQLPVATAVVAEAAETPAAEPAHDFTQTAEKFVKTHCADCHSGSDPTADLDLTRFTSWEDVRQRRRLWQEVVHLVATNQMPPEDMAQPDPADKAAFQLAVTTELDRVDCSQYADPGKPTLRRLNRSEYRHTIRDLLAVDFEPNATFPVDDTGYGFDTIGDVLTLSPLLLEKYLDAAEIIAGQAIMDRVGQANQETHYDAEKLRGGDLAKWQEPVARRLNSNGRLLLPVDIAVAGTYRFRIHAFGDQAGDEPCKIVVIVDSKRGQTVDVPATADKPAWYEVTLDLKAGKRILGVEFINDFYDPEAADKRRRDRNFGVHAFALVGPDKLPDALVPEFQRLMAIPAQPADWRQAATTLFAKLVPRAYRHPVEPAEVARYVDLVGMRVNAGESFDRGVQFALTALLVSPHFLYRVETADPTNQPAGPDGIAPVGRFNLASRLSYFLWSSMPDRELFHLAATGQLSDPAVLAQQVRRMIVDPRSDAFVANFCGQWLETRRLAEVDPDKQLFPEWDDDLRAALRQETELLFASILREDRRLTDFLAPDYTYLNARLARHYGIAGVGHKEMQRVALTDERRGGILTHGSFLTITSRATRTSAVMRGAWVLEQLLGTPPPPPPPDAPQLEEKTGAHAGTIRQQLEVHRQNAICASCHDRMDPLGFGLENFDAIGRWREQENGQAIDASGVLPDGAKFAGPVELKRVLLSKKDEFVRALAEKLLTYALGRGLGYRDDCVLEKIVNQTTADDDYRFATLLIAVVTSDPFVKTRLQDRHD